MRTDNDCAIGLASQDPAHYGRFARLIPTLFLFRQVDETLATEALRMASEDAARDANLIKQLTTANPGECLMKDLRRRLGEVQIRLPARPDRSTAVMTTPGEAR